jgi:type II secretory pathway component PulJ
MRVVRKIRLRRRGSPEEGITLIECLLYIALFLVIGTLAFASYHRVDFETRALDRNADDIIRAMKAGEQWRTDVRQATAAPRIENGAMRLATRNGEVIYSVRDGVLWRQAGAKSLPVLERVKASSMRPDARQHVTAWRWEVEMQTKRAQASVRPLFTFVSVPGSEVRR